MPPLGLVAEMADPPLFVLLKETLWPPATVKRWAVAGVQRQRPQRILLAAPMFSVELAGTTRLVAAKLTA